mmetsp:Transcript_41238/g.47505  ORF Transcript_41238/g.47505 Transcript_41238/m.47505 type:complete len:348 (+) Transcript_41238:2393-3436(+)
MVSSDAKDSSIISHVIQIYNTVMRSIHESLQFNKISLSLAFNKVKQIHKTLKSIFTYLISTDEIAKVFFFEEKGFDYFLDLLISPKIMKISETMKVSFEQELTIDTSNALNKEETKDYQPELPSTEDDFAQEDELLEYISSKITQSPVKPPKHAENKNDMGQEEAPLSIVKQNRPITSSDFPLNEFARTMTLVDSNISKIKELGPNTDWSVNKKGYRQRLISQKYGPEHNNEIWFLFKLNRIVEVKEIQVGFTNFWTVETEVYIEPGSVIVEAGMNENETTALCSLEKLDDKGFANFGSTIYGINLYSFRYQSNSDDLESVIKANFNSLQTMRARFIKFRVRSNSIT